MVVTNYKRNVDFVQLLKDCAKRKDLYTGTKLHADILKTRLLETNPYAASALISMYAKCGALPKTQHVFNSLTIRNISSWNALISGYVQHGRAHQALICYEEMQKEGLIPNAVTFICVLKACGTIGDINKGNQIHDVIVGEGLLRKDVALGTALVDMYAKCGLLQRAHQVLLEEIPLRNTVSWGALIAGYAEDGQDFKALKCFQQMRKEGILPDVITLTCILKICGIMGAIEEGMDIHDWITNGGLLAKDVVLGNALIDMYAKFGMLEKASEIFNELPLKDVITWNTLISGHTQQWQGGEALKCFEQMQRDGVCPNPFTFACALKACGNVGATEKGKEIHDAILKKGLLEGDIVLGNALIDMYAKCGILSKALQVLDELPVRDVMSWNALIAGYVQHGKHHEALWCLEQMTREGVFPDGVTLICSLKACGNIRAISIGKIIHKEIITEGWMEEDNGFVNALIDMYAKCGAIEEAKDVVDKLCYLDTDVWNALMSGYVRQGQAWKALNCFERLKSENISPNGSTCISICKACASMQCMEKGVQIHSQIIYTGFLQNDVVLGTSLVDMYVKCGVLGKAQQVHDDLPFRNTISWNSLLAGYAQEGQGRKVLKCFDEMQKENVSPDEVTFICILKACGSIHDISRGKHVHNDIITKDFLKKGIACIALGNALIDMYTKCGMLTKASKVLNELPVRDVVSWSSLIAGFTQHEQDHEALRCFMQMQREGVSPNVVTYICILKACTNTGAIDLGKQIHDEIVEKGLMHKDTAICNALIDMYSKCGALTKAEQVLNEVMVRDVVSWTAIIAGYAQHGQAPQALDCFERMQREGVPPDAITLLCVLNACSRSGLVQEAELCFEKIIRKYGLKPNLDHHICMVRVFAFAGHFDKAMSVINRMPSSDHPTIWLAMLSACRKWGNTKLGRLAFDNAVRLDKTNPVQYLLMASIYAAAGMQKDKESIEVMRMNNVLGEKHGNSLWADLN